MRGIGLCVGIALAAGAAHAGDGSWTQVDGWAGGVQWSTTAERGNWQIATAAGEDDGAWWMRAALLRTWQVGPEKAPWKLRAGLVGKADEVAWWDAPDLARSWCLPDQPERCGAWRPGVRVAVERWAEYGNWGTFLMAEWTSIDSAKLGVAGLTHLPSGIGAQLSIWHETGGEVTPGVMLSLPVTKRISVRLGHKFVEDETFLGCSVSTY